ncbi:MAG: hypothetical protein ACREBF_05040 [Candidatus Micrarchaeales archaeon]
MQIRKPNAAENTAIIMRIPVRAELRSSFKKLRVLLTNYPGMRLVADGSELAYRIDEAAHFSILKFGNDYIIEEIHANSSPVYLFRVALLRLLSIIAIVDGIYSVRIESLFPYLVTELASNHFQKESPRKPSTSQSDIILAKRITELLCEIERLEVDNKDLQEQRSSLASQLLVRELIEAPASLDELSKRYRISKTELVNAIQLSYRMGYRTIRHAANKISMVKE